MGREGIGVGVEYDVVVNVASAGIGALVGAGVGRLRHSYRYRFHQAFWSFLQQPTVFVVGELESGVLMNTLHEALERLVDQPIDRRMLTREIVKHVEDQEISGLIGRGDVDAIINMVVRFASLRVPGKPTILPSSKISDWNAHNFVVIGGVDVNPFMSALSARLGCQLEGARNDQGRNVIRDLKLRTEYPVEPVGRLNDQGQPIVLDYGILARGRNPDNPDRTVLLLLGAHGLGTFAASEICLRDEEQKRLYRQLRDYHGQFECLIRCERVIDGPSKGQTTIELEWSRGLGGQRH
jgi:hypothetical protein